MADREYHVPDAYRAAQKSVPRSGYASKAARYGGGKGAQKGTQKKCTVAGDAMLDLSHPYFEQALADFKRFEGIKSDAALSRGERRLFECRVLTGRIVIRLPERAMQDAETQAKESKKYSGVQSWDDILTLVKAASAP